MAEQDIPEPRPCGMKETGLVHYVGWKETLDSIERCVLRKLNIIDAIVDAEVKSVTEEAEKVIASIYDLSVQESVEVDKYENLAKAQEKLAKIYKDGPPSKFAELDELKTMVDDCLELFEFNQPRFDKFSNVPTVREVDSDAVLEAIIYAPCLALCIMAFVTLILV